MKPDLLRALVLSGGVLDEGPPLARASRDSIVLDSALESLPPGEWPALIARCREALRPDGVLALRLAPAAAVDHSSLREMLAHRFGAVEIFAWDGLRRRPSAEAETADLFALCWPYLPYAMRSLELLRPRVVADGPDWRSSWLCERPELPERFLLRATLDAIGVSAGFDLRLRFLTSTSARLKIEAHLDCEDLAFSGAELLVASARATIRGEPSWAEVERIAIDVKTGAGTTADVRISDVRVCDMRISAGRVSGRSGASPRVFQRTSAQLRGGYDANYYQDMSGYGLGQELHEHVNLHRAYALLLAPAPTRVLDVGAARGELARHLLQQGSEVTLLDYSATAMDLARRLIGERPGVRFIVDEAANLGAHVPPHSQDAIFMTDFVEHVNVQELRQILGACRRALAPDGVLVIHTPERYSGAIVTAKAIHGLHLHLFEIDSLRELLEEAFGAVEVFTWDGFERFHQRGHCIELFALAWPAGNYLVHSLSVTSGAIERPGLPSRFLLDATVEIEPPATEGELEIVFQGAAGETLARAARELARLRTFPVQLRLASELLLPASSSSWEDVERIAVRANAGGGEPIGLSLHDVRLSAAARRDSVAVV
ncbi:MAG TPA: class I SAM-dependent methyltransferase [Solirubrobacteraceae bacterium]|nr:class I SAM-dependent methyltransferase [Solirubrobacteraceae bacterium]